MFFGSFLYGQLKLQASFPGGVSQSLHTPMVFVRAPIKANGLHASGNRSFCDRFADGDVNNNRVRRDVVWNPDNVLAGARHITLGGHYAYVAADRGLVIVDLDDPTTPRLAAVIPLSDVRASALQFRYLFVTDASGLRVVDVTRPDSPRLLWLAIR